MQRDNLWREWYAWFPVKPIDENQLFWLETIWRRIDPETSGWIYKSFRSDLQRETEAAMRCI
ncbi:hypothetical protein MKJ03_20265 (plasmid) [Rhizobium sp. SSM4.3]|uniref:Uncharacterized protein n=1 Tax=Peteryoungia algae TaxID=2919917 RepID=A0ABT0D5K4_9HYPH|nr:hypothetical protein [Rhizobium sp. SSM4.3]MCJ8240675.1 hypothetical protein [Rhizobium sp. SSM4.3]